MNEISSGVTFWILETWRKTSAQLQVSIFRSKESRGSPGAIWRVSPIAQTVSVIILDDLGQKKEWRLPLGGCKFSFGVPAESSPFPEFAEGKWVSYLSVEMPDGKVILFAERFAKE